MKFLREACFTIEISHERCIRRAMNVVYEPLTCIIHFTVLLARFVIALFAWLQIFFYWLIYSYSVHRKFLIASWFRSTIYIDYYREFAISHYNGNHVTESAWNEIVYSTKFAVRIEVSFCTSFCRVYSTFFVTHVLIFFVYFFFLHIKQVLSSYSMSAKFNSALTECTDL